MNEVRMNKKFFLIVLMSICIFIFFINNYHSEFEYKVYDNSVCITKYLKNKEIVNIPDYIEGKPVTKIGKNAFSKNREIETNLVIIDFWNLFFYTRKDIKQVKFPSMLLEIDSN